MAEHDQRQRVGAGGNAAAAIGDDLLFESANCRRTFGRNSAGRQVGAGRRIEQRAAGTLTLPLDPADPAVNRCRRCRRAARGSARSSCRCRRPRSLRAPPPCRPSASDLRGRRNSPAGGPCRAGFDRTPFAGPFLQPAVEHCGAVEAEYRATATRPARPLRSCRAVEDHVAAFADAKAAHRRRECLGTTAA